METRLCSALLAIEHPLGGRLDSSGICGDCGRIHQDAAEARTECGHMCRGGDGVVRSCDLKAGHTGLHGKTIVLRGSMSGTYRSTTNWGDDGLAWHATRGRSYDNGRSWVAHQDGRIGV
jgi:hypothetical protein